MGMTLMFQSDRVDSHSDPRVSMVVHGEPPGKRTVSDDRGMDIDFLSLPHNIRNNIYAKIVVKPDSFVGAESQYTKPFYRDAITWRNLAFAGTCRKVWNESLEIYVAQNGFEFFYICPFLEFREKISIRGRLLLKTIKSHHHHRSNPFIILRLLRSCNKSPQLEVFACVRATVDQKKLWFDVFLRNAKEFFLSDLTRIVFGPTTAFYQKTADDMVVPNLATKDASGVYVERSLRRLINNLERVKAETSGNYKR